MDEENRIDKIEQRLTRLEDKIAELERVLNMQSEATRGSATEAAINRSESGGVVFEETTHSEEPEESWIRDSFIPGENWLHWLGIALLLLGVVFLFKYSIDRGWLIPPVRSAIGLATGLGLFMTGIHTDKAKARLRQILMGGGVSAFYITGFATFQLYSFISYPAAWAFMIGVTLLALSLSLRQNEPVLSILGTVGGLGTPFMLYRGEGSLTMLILYYCLIAGGSGTIYLYKGWKSLLWTTVAGGWLVLLVGYFNNIYEVLHPAESERWSLQAGAFFSAIVFWGVPVIREILRSRDRDKWPEPGSDKTGEGVDKFKPFESDPNVQALAVLTPVGILFYSIGIWSISSELWGAVALTSSLLLGYSYLPLRNEGLKKLSMVHGFSALILMTAALFLLLEGEILLITLALEGFILRLIAARTGDRNISISSHLLFGLVGIWLLDRFITGTVAPLAMVNLDALTELFIIGIAGLAVPANLKSGNEQLVYRLTAHFAMLGWFLKELSVLEEGQAFVTTAWGVYALAVLFIGFWKDIGRLRFIGMGTVFLVVGKLFLIDLSQLQTLLRIMLFIGFGILFLGAGYVLQTRWGDRFIDIGPGNDDRDSVERGEQTGFE